MSKTQVRSIIINLFNEKPTLKGIEPDQDFFDTGASSLTIVDLQMQVESELKVTVPTATLMNNPTLSGWIAAYSEGF